MIHLELGWKSVLHEEFEKPYFKALKQKLVQEINSGKVIFPLPKYIFQAFDACPWDGLKVVILGQDPYHSLSVIKENSKSQAPNPKESIPHAHGLSFSIPSEAEKIPPSLQNIYKELQSDLGIPIPAHGHLISWAHQGVLLLNAALTVEAHQANSHADLGWHQFTDQVIQTISDQKEHIVFILWGNFARSKKVLINQEKHLIIESPHPSPFSAFSGFFGSRPFSRTNEYLEKHQIKPIDWTLSD